MSENEDFSSMGNNNMDPNGYMNAGNYGNTGNAAAPIINGVQTPLVTTQINTTAGVIGAVIGALLGSVVWIVVGSLGYVSGWIAFLMIFLSMTMYKKLGNGIDKKGKIISGVIAMLMIMPSSFIVYCIEIVQYLKEDQYISITFGQAAPIVLQDILSADSQLRGGFVILLLQGYFFAALALFIFICNKKQTEAAKLRAATFTDLHAAKKTTTKKYLFATACLIIGIILFVVLCAYNQVMLGMMIMMIGLMVFLVYIIKGQTPVISMSHEGFTYNDGKGHKALKIIPWDSIASAQEPSEDKFCRINTKDMKTYLIDGSQIPRFGEFWGRVISSTNGMPSVVQTEVEQAETV